MNDRNDNRPKLPSHIAFCNEDGSDEKNYRQKIGAVWKSKGDDLWMKLSALPLDGKIVLRSREDLERRRAERQEQNQKL